VVSCVNISVVPKRFVRAIGILQQTYEDTKGHQWFIIVLSACRCIKNVRCTHVSQVILHNFMSFYVHCSVFSTTSSLSYIFSIMIFILPTSLTFKKVQNIGQLLIDVVVNIASIYML
jgi:hypothetical protein